MTDFALLMAIVAVVSTAYALWWATFGGEGDE